uniref:uncharacterized protein n=1 Tax=Myxine glutinosa TaxID=7769 RepID=UPI00358E40D7
MTVYFVISVEQVVLSHCPLGSPHPDRSMSDVSCNEVNTICLLTSMEVPTVGPPSPPHRSHDSIGTDVLAPTPELIRTPTGEDLETPAGSPDVNPTRTGEKVDDRCASEYKGYKGYNRNTSHFGSGTNAKVFINLCGEITCVESELKTSTRDPFENGQKDHFTINGPYLGHLTKLKIWHDGAGVLPRWFLEKVTVKEPLSGMSYTFTCNCWIDGNSRKTLSTQEKPKEMTSYVVKCKEEENEPSTATDPWTEANSINVERNITQHNTTESTEAITLKEISKPNAQSSGMPRRNVPIAIGFFSIVCLLSVVLFIYLLIRTYVKGSSGEDDDVSQIPTKNTLSHIPKIILQQSRSSACSTNAGGKSKESKNEEENKFGKKKNPFIITEDYSTIYSKIQFTARQTREGPHPQGDPVNYANIRFNKKLAGSSPFTDSEYENVSSHAGKGVEKRNCKEKECVYHIAGTPGARGSKPGREYPKDPDYAEPWAEEL